MNTWILSISSFLGAVLWLALLVATAFSMVVLSIGLLAALYMLNASTGQGHLSTRKTRTLQPVVDRSSLGPAKTRPDRG